VIGAAGKRMLSVAAREANIVGMLMGALPTGPHNWADAASSAFDQKVAWVRDAAGERFGDLELTMFPQRTVVTSDRARAAEECAKAWGIPADLAAESPIALLGTIEEMVDQLEARRARFGVSYVCVFGEVLEDFAPVVARLAGT